MSNRLMMATDDGAAKGAPAKIRLYEDIAARIAAMIGNGTYQAGERLPSIRELSRKMHVSINTVMAAYAQLEGQDLIEARPQSGYFVRSPLAGPGSRLVEAASRACQAKRAGASEIVAALENPALIPLGASAPNPELLPVNRLNNMLAAQIRRRPAESISYAPAAGVMRLRKQIAKRLLASGCTVTPEDIVVTSGCVEALTLALQATCRPGDTVAVATPVFWTFLSVIQSLGLNVLEIPSDPSEGVSVDVLSYALRQKTIQACVVISNFNNPLGGVIPDERKRQLAELFARREVPLIEDDVYGDLAFASERPLSIKAFDAEGWVLHCSSFSKTLAPGYRVGWIAPGRFRSEVEMLKKALSIATASPMQLAVAEFLAYGGYERHLRSLRRACCWRMKQVRAVIERSFPPGTRITRPEGGTFLWVEAPDTVDAYALFERALALGVSVAPGRLFSTSGDYRNCLRLNTAFWSENVEAALKIIGGLATELARADG